MLEGVRHKIEDKYKDLQYNFSKFKYTLKNNRGATILIACLVMYLVSNAGMISVACSGFLLYLCLLGRELLDHKKEKDRLDSIDLTYFQTADKNLEDPLDGYVDMCINEYMLLNRGFQNESYIKEKEEAEIRKGVIELLATNMGPDIKKKFELYYGAGGQVEAILARKCFIRIALYVANVNKNTYVDPTTESKELDNLFRDSMIMKDDFKNVM